MIELFQNAWVFLKDAFQTVMMILIFLTITGFWEVVAAFKESRDKKKAGLQDK